MSFRSPLRGVSLYTGTGTRAFLGRVVLVEGVAVEADSDEGPDVYDMPVKVVGAVVPGALDESVIASSHRFVCVNPPHHCNGLVGFG